MEAKVKIPTIGKFSTKPDASYEQDRLVLLEPSIKDISIEEAVNSIRACIKRKFDREYNSVFGNSFQGVKGTLPLTHFQSQLR